MVMGQEQGDRSLVRYILKLQMGKWSLSAANLVLWSDVIGCSRHFYIVENKGILPMNRKVIESNYGAKGKQLKDKFVLTNHNQGRR